MSLSDNEALDLRIVTDESEGENSDPESESESSIIDVVTVEDCRGEFIDRNGARLYDEKENKNTVENPVSDGTSEANNLNAEDVPDEDDVISVGEEVLVASSCPALSKESEIQGGEEDQGNVGENDDSDYAEEVPMASPSSSVSNVGEKRTIEENQVNEEDNSNHDEVPVASSSPATRKVGKIGPIQEDRENAGDEEDNNNADEVPMASPPPPVSKVGEKGTIEESQENDVNEEDNNNHDEVPVASSSPAARKVSKKRAIQEDREDARDEEDNNNADEVPIASQLPPVSKVGEKRPIDEDEQNDGDEEDNDDDDDRLEDEDYELLEENLGVKIRRRYKRLKRMVDSSDSEDIDYEPKKSCKPTRSSKRVNALKVTYTDEQKRSEDSESDSDAFIVDENDQPIRRQITAAPEYTDEKIVEAREIFGGDFDYGDILSGAEDVDDQDSELEASRSEYEDEDISDDDGRSSRARTDIIRKRKTKSVIISKVYEPSVLEEAGITDEAIKICKTDIPERFQLRRFPLAITGSELKGECAWIFEKFFSARLTQQMPTADDGEASTTKTIVNDECWDDDVSTISKVQQSAVPAKGSNLKAIYLTKISKILKLMRNSHYEVPYIYFHQKDLVKPEFSIYDLWKICTLDEEYCRIHQRQQRLIQLFASMKAYQQTQDEEYLEEQEIRMITDDDFEQIHGAKSLTELDDIQALFSIYYADDVPKMKAVMEAKNKEIREKENEEGVNGGFPSEVNEDFGMIDRKRSNAGAYRYCRRLGIHRLLPLIGLTAEEFGENFEAGDIVHQTHQPEIPLVEVLKIFSATCQKDEGTVAAAARHMLATNFARDCRLRKIVRKFFLAKATISVSPTRRGVVVIDENHPLFPIKFLKDKPIMEILGVDFLELLQGEKEGLVNFKLGNDIPGKVDSSISLTDEAKAFFKSESEDPVNDEWNTFRAKIVEVTFERFLYPEFRKEARYQLLKKANEEILARCGDRIYALISDAPYTVDYEKDNSEGDWDTSEGIRVLALAYEEDMPIAGVVLDKKGEVLKSIFVTNWLTKHFRRQMDDVDKLKEKDSEKLREVIEETKPHVVAISGESRGAINLEGEIREILFSFPEWEMNFKLVPVLIIDNELSKVYSRTATAIEEFPGTGSTECLRQAVSLGRYLQDPLLEVAQLCNRNEDILCLHLNKYQRQIPKEELLRTIEVEIINRTCETGVDINEAAAQKHRSHLLQFLGGFGYHKANALLRKLRQENAGIVENRNDLVTRFGVGPSVFNNAAGFIRIKETLPEEANVDPRDQTRIHPQHYGHALVVARAAQPDGKDYSHLSDYDLMEKAMVNVDFQNNLLVMDLQDYTEQLKSKGFGDLTRLFNSIIAELVDPYFEVRKPFHIPDTDELFYILTKETVETIREGKLVTAYVNGAKWRKPTQEDCNEVVPMKDPSTGRVICTFCAEDFPVVKNLWEHYETDSCPGDIYAINLRFGNGISGVIRMDKMSDGLPNTKDLTRLISLRLPIQVRVLKVDLSKFFIECTARLSDLKNADFMPVKDPYYDEDAEKQRSRLFKVPNKPPPVGGYMRRNITHPSYKNVSFATAEEILKDMDQGDVIFRPSSKGFDVLALTWNVAPGVLQHVNIIEKNKRSDYELGSTLSIGILDFEDLDEIIVRFVNPQASYAREIIRFKYFKNEDYESIEDATKYLQGMREKKPNRTHYVIVASRKNPGSFILSYIPHHKVFQEVIHITPDGIWLRNLCYPSIQDCIDHWKGQFKTSHALVTGTPAASIIDSVFTTA